MRRSKPSFLVMLTEALQRNAKHEARLSNISGCWLGERLERNDLRFFASLRMTDLQSQEDEAPAQNFRSL